MATIWTAGFLLLGFALAQVNDQVNANVDYGTFCNPSSYVRPKFRYWLPDASVDEATVSADIESSTSIGAGGVEFLGFYNYGGELGITPPGADWTVYGFGTPAFQSQFKNALETSKRLGLVMDFPLGPNQGQGVPAEVTDPGLQWDLVSKRNQSSVELLLILLISGSVLKYILFKLLGHHSGMGFWGIGRCCLCGSFERDESYTNCHFDSICTIYPVLPTLGPSKRQLN